MVGHNTLRVLPKPAFSVASSLDGLFYKGFTAMLFVPVVDQNQQPLMPTTPRRARGWLASGKATAFWSRGVFCVRLNVEPSSRLVQTIAVGVDPGSKREAYTVKSEDHTFLNVLSDAVTWVKRAVEAKRNARSARRQRKTPCRSRRQNRRRGALPPSTKARWQLKLNVCKWLLRLYPVKVFVVEDVKAKSRKGKGGNWNAGFSPITVGKKWFYEQLVWMGHVELLTGFETFELRNQHGLKKSSHKMAERFDAHCVDSWVLANWYVGGHDKPDNESMLLISPIRLHRRQLHRLQPGVGGIRSHYGGTRSLGLKRGSLVKHPKYGLTYVGGCPDGRISLHSISSGKRITHKAKPEQTTFVCYNPWRVRCLLAVNTLERNHNVPAP